MTPRWDQLASARMISILWAGCSLGCDVLGDPYDTYLYIYISL